MAKLIAYAGKHTAKVDRRKRVCEAAYNHFKLGRTSMAVATIQHVSEATALKRITIGRCLHHGLPIPYASDGA